MTTNEILDLLPEPTPKELDAEKWRQARFQYVNTVVDEERRDRLNNFRMLNLQLWSDVPEVVEFAHTLALELWGKSHKVKHKHLKVILVNLLDSWVNDPQRYLGYSRRNVYYPNIPGKYNPAHITKSIVPIIKDMATAEFIEDHKGRYNVEFQTGYFSKCRAQPDFITRMLEADIEPAMITLHPAAELLLLRKPNTHKYKGNGKTQKMHGDLIDYEDTERTMAIKEFLSTYNASLKSHDIRVPGLPVPHSKPVYRVFNDGSWDHGGRFVGGWWMNCNPNTRKDILIDGHPTTELDFRCCLPSLMYARKGLECPGDLYHLPGFERDIVKRAFLRIMNNKGKGRAIRGMEKDIKQEFPQLEGLVDCTALMDKLIESHPLISDGFFQKCGNLLMSLESQITEAILKAMTMKGICCLSIHDSYVVPREHEPELRQAMIEAFREVMDVTFTPAIK